MNTLRRLVSSLPALVALSVLLVCICVGLLVLLLSGGKTLMEVVR